MFFDKASNHCTKTLKKKTYVVPIIHISLITMETGFAAGSIVTIYVEDNNMPSVTDWVERENEQTWNF